MCLTCSSAVGPQSAAMDTKDNMDTVLGGSETFRGYSMFCHAVTWRSISARFPPSVSGQMWVQF
ncbi:unnamed protein product [Ectocarpus sp. CCAP 1310/34]|nr:unnamed protein product [Ectocarpus sp. CCAP 1310/34]